MLTGFAGVLGWPLRHTLSPAIHNAAFRHLGLNCTYLAWPVRPEDLPAAVGGLRALGAIGANVTIPHKEAVVGLLDTVSDHVRAVGAANTIQRVGGALIGHNTDVVGFARFLVADAGVDVTGRSALVLGAGGAARAVVKALDDLGAARIVIAGRDGERASAVASLTARASAESWDAAAAVGGRSDLIVNATPLGAEGRDPVPDLAFRAEQVVVDLVYLPPATPLVERARAAGCRAWGGVGMLVGQAAAAFQIWTGQDPPLEVMSAAALRALTRAGGAPAP